MAPAPLPRRPIELLLLPQERRPFLLRMEQLDGPVERVLHLPEQKIQKIHTSFTRVISTLGVRQNGRRLCAGLARRSGSGWPFQSPRVGYLAIGTSHSPTYYSSNRSYIARHSRSRVHYYPL